MQHRKIPRRWFNAGVALASLGLIVFSIYLIVLDRDIRSRFAGARWTLPAQVYASPLELYPGLEYKPEDLRRELLVLGYREDRSLTGPGTFSLNKAQIDLVSRAFIFWDGPQSATNFAVRFAGGAIADIRSPGQTETQALVRLDPLLIGSIYPREGEDRVLVKLETVPPLLISGLLHVEDQNFEDHFGIDVFAILRAAFANLLAGRVVQGGSTITQQLVKNFFLSSERSFRRKLNEVLMALLLEAHYDKPEILEAYLNEVYLGQDGERAVHGFGLASQFYFNKPLPELRVHEFALLVALVKGPSYYNPRRHVERAKARRDLVLGMFAEAGYLKPEELKRALNLPLGVTGVAGKTAGRYPAFVDLVRRQLRGQYPESVLTGEGLRIFTTLEPRAQEALESRIRSTLETLDKVRKPKGAVGRLEAAGVVTTTEGGQVLALAGGREANFAGFNRAIDSRRPIGSLAKPFVYLAALMQPQRFNLGTILDDEAIEVPQPTGEIWEPHNYDDQAHGPIPLYRALAQSYNYATVRLGLEVGAPAVSKVFEAAGFPGGAPPAYHSMFLGSLHLAPLEVAQLYSTLASNGYYTPLLAIREVLAKEGQPLTRYEFNVHRTLPEGPLHLLNWALEQVVQTGTAASTAIYVPRSTRLAGKTGTTDELRDSWFAGFGADRVAVVWVGRDDNTPAGFTGASGALQVWAPLMADMHARGLEPRLPSDVEEIEIDPVTGLRADSGCAETVLIPYIKDYPLENYAACAHGRSPLRWLQDRF